MEIIWNNGALAKFTILSRHLFRETEENTINLKIAGFRFNVHLTAIKHVCDIGLCGITSIIIYEKEYRNNKLRIVGLYEEHIGLKMMIV